MRIKALLFAAVLSAVSSNVFAFEHLVKENVSTTFTLRDGDKVVFLDNNSAWGMANRLVFGISLVSGQVLSGSLVVNDCAYSLEGYYKEVDFAYEKGVVVKYHGPEQLVRIQGWKDSAPAVAKCEDVGSASVVVRDDEKKTQEELDWLAKKAEQQLQYAVKTAQYRDLGPLETVTLFEGPSGLFKVTKLPEWDFSRIYVQVEPMDGRELNGGLYSNEVSQKLSGWSISIPVNRMTDMPFDFELAFPEYRKVKLKWWATMEAANEEAVQVTEKSLGGDSVEATYTYEHSGNDIRSVKLNFRKSAFVNGSIPVVKSFDTNPDGVMRIDSLKSYGALGAVYDVHAEFKGNDTITFALPLEYSYNPNDDSVYVLHQVDGKWVNVPVDSVKDGFAYFRTNSFSLFEIGFFCLIMGCSESPLVLMKHFYEKLSRLGMPDVCRNIGIVENLVKAFDGEHDDWEIGQGTLDFNEVLDYAEENGFDGSSEIYEMLKNKKMEALYDFSDENIKAFCNEDENVEICKWKITKHNLDVLLADAILSQRKTSRRRFTKVQYSKNKEKIILAEKNQEYDFSDYFKIDGGFLEEAYGFIKGLSSCMDAMNFDVKVIQNWIDFGRGLGDDDVATSCLKFFNSLDLYSPISELGDDIINCSEISMDYLSSFWRDYITKEKEGKLQAISEAMVRVSLLAWVDKTMFRNFMLFVYKKTYDGVHEWLKLADPLMMKNNIVAKAYASLSLFEYIHNGKSNNFDKLNESLKKHYGEHGGYSEGMGYSQYIWDDVPYVLSALMDAYASKGKKLKIEEKFLKSPDYIFRFSRPVGKTVEENGEQKYMYYGLIPVEIDDGCTYNPEYRVWAKLKDDAKYLAYSERYPLLDENKKNVLLPFGFPKWKLYSSSKKTIKDRGSVWARKQDGIAMITAMRLDDDGNVADTIALSLIAENGDLWKCGQSHDQQDNLSITLTSRNDGFIIQDRGYRGFNHRRADDGFHRYLDHNVLYSTKAGNQSDNEPIEFDDLYGRVKAFTGSIPGVLQTILMGVFEMIASFRVDEKYDYSVQGGAEAYMDGDVIPSNEITTAPGGAEIVDWSIENSSKDFFAYTAYSNYIGESDSATMSDYRTIMYYEGSFWVIDRPRIVVSSDLSNSDFSLTWLANSPIKDWRNTKIKLYGSSDKYFGEDEEDAVEGVKVAVRQNGNRADYTYDEDLGGVALSNYSYSFKDESAKTFVMSYAVNDEGFVKTADRCPKDYQCFENAAKDKRLVVPPQGAKFSLCDALPKNECSGEVKSSGITFFEKYYDMNGWLGDGIVGGEMTVKENGEDYEIIPMSLFVNDTILEYETKSHEKFSKHFVTKYLPANAILLR